MKKTRTVHKTLNIDPHCDTFGVHEYQDLAKLMNWRPKSPPKNLRAIRVKVELDVEDEELLK